MSHFTNSPAAPPEIRNQQVDGSSPFAGSTEQKTYRPVTFETRWQGAYRGAYRRLMACFRVSPTARLQPFTDDLDTAKRTEALTKRIRG